MFTKSLVRTRGTYRRLLVKRFNYRGDVSWCATGGRTLIMTHCRLQRSMHQYSLRYAVRGIGVPELSDVAVQ